MIESYIIEELAAVAKWGTLSRVAEELHVSQSAISRSMQKLEDALGVTLFDRSKNRIALNEIGEIAARHARNVIAAHDTLVRAVQDANRRLRTFSYGSIAPAPIWTLTPLLSERLSGMTVSADLRDTEEELLRALDGGIHQMIVLARPLKSKAPEGKSRLASFPLMRERLSVLLPKSHRLAAKKKVRLSDLAGEKILIHDKIGFWYGICKRRIPHAVFLEQSDRATMLELARATDLPSFVTDLSAALAPAPEGKVSVPVTDDVANVQFWCVCPADKAEEYAALLAGVGREEAHAR